MKNIEYDSVNITGGFWKNKQELNKNVTIEAVYKQFSDTGRIDAFNFNWREGMEKQPHVFWDSDVAKWIEGAVYILKKHDIPSLRQRVENLIDCIEKNQCEDGYFNIYFTVCKPEDRFKNRDCHELYCAGHLIEAAVAYSEVFGNDRFLNCMIRYVNYIEMVFIKDKSASFVTPGHEEIELALIRLYRYTKNKKYLDIARFFIDNRGNNSIDSNEKVNQSHAPVREQMTAEGHCVRAGYLYTAMAELAYELKDKALEASCKSILNDIVNSKMYITGGIGSSHIGEAFTIPYDLPNEQAYAETCAAISMMFFSDRMMQLENNSVYADIIEREMYNGMISGLSLDGQAFFYENPLEINLKNHFRNTCSHKQERFPITQRKKVFDCSCCPPNINRIIASIGRYIYGYNDKSVYINQFVTSTAEFGDIKISQQTDYPSDGKVIINSVGVERLYIRIPSWCKKYSISESYYTENGYAVIDNPPGKTECVFEMSVKLIEADPRVADDYGKAAISYGPVIYCCEGCDNGDNLYELYISKDLNAKKEYSEFFDAHILFINGFRKERTDTLYSELSDNFEPCEIKLIPYFGFANRGESDMLVWMQVR